MQVRRKGFENAELGASPAAAQSASVSKARLLEWSRVISYGPMGQVGRQVAALFSLLRLQHSPHCAWGGEGIPRNQKRRSTQLINNAAPNRRMRCIFQVPSSLNEHGHQQEYPHSERKGFL